MIRRAALVAAAVVAAPAAAQQVPVIPPAADPGAIQQRQLEQERRRREEERERLAPKAPLKLETPEAPAPRAPAEAVRFLVREIDFTPSEILSAAELEAIAADYRGRQVTLADLQQLAERINALYKAKGVVTARAVIPPQDVSGGVVRVQLVEGKLGRISIEGNATTSSGYIEDRLLLKRAELIDLKRLEGALVRFNRTNDVQLRAELKPGAEFATTDLHVAAEEPPRQEVRFSLDNLGTPATGRTRSGETYLNRSLLGFRDELSVSATQADGQESRAYSYAFPLNRWGGRLSLAYLQDRTSLVHGPLSTLNVKGESQSRVLSLRQPTYVSNGLELDLLAGAKSRYTSNWVDTVFLLRTDTSDRSLGAELQGFDAKTYWSLNYTRYNGRATAIDSTSYTIDRGSARFNRQLTGPYSFRSSFSWQSTTHMSLPSSELFFVGGEGTVRGYDIGTYSGDRGYAANLELHRQFASHTLGRSQLDTSGFVFLDFGAALPFLPPNSTQPSRQRLSSIGLGMNASMGRSVFGRVTFGYGLDDVPLAPRHYAITFQLAASIF